jgi:hypothetical protein
MYLITGGASHRIEFAEALVRDGERVRIWTTSRPEAWIM